MKQIFVNVEETIEHFLLKCGGKEAEKGDWFDDFVVQVSSDHVQRLC